MRIVCISDTHGFSLKQIDSKVGLPDGDVLVHAGDFTERGEVAYLSRFVESAKDYDYDEIIVVAGNHDFCFQNDLEMRSKEIIEEECYYLDSDFVVIDGVKFYGTPWSNKFGNWAFMGTEEQLDRVYSAIDHNTDVLLSHGPPYGILDKVKNSRPDEDPHVGSKSLKRKIDKMDLDSCVFGHIHEAYGHKEIDGVDYVNASVLNLDYELVNEPIVIDV